MSYCYANEKPKLFTEDGQAMFLKARDDVKRLLKVAGAFRYDKVNFGSGDSWTMMACIDRLVEMGEIVELPRKSWAQFRVYTTPQVSNL